MTDRLSGFLVVLKDDLREDDAEGILNAIRLLSGVLDVEPVKADLTGQAETMRLRYELLDKIVKLIRDDTQ